MYEWRTPWILSAAVFVGLLLPAIVQQGMFLDGVSYASISRNMAEGHGSFSAPYYTSALYPVCHEQPPLVFWLQSFFFRVFGDHFWVERLYALGAALATLFGIVLNWNLFSAQNTSAAFKSKPVSWLPVLIWTICPIVFWAYSNNMLECSMCGFVLLATWFAGKSAFEQQYKWLIPAAMAISAAVLCKGPVGFFPLFTPLAIGFAFPKVKAQKAVQDFLILTSLCAGILIAFIALVPGMTAYFNDYLETRLFATLSGARDEQVSNRLYFLMDLLSQFAVPALFLLVLFLKKSFGSTRLQPASRFYFLMGLAGSIPLVLSPKQSTHYLLPSLPYFAMGLAIIAAPWVADSLKSWNAKAIKWRRNLAWVIFGITMVTALSNWGEFRRDETLITSVSAICQELPRGATISIPLNQSSNWSLIAYFSRIGNISLDSRAAHEYYLTQNSDIAPDGYGLQTRNNQEYRLWKRQ